ncbi:SDR family NAD(P)-dependent oxidoreductase [Arthrobacter sp. AQ5-05]|uniref:SDR family NAD(P)-dependent oxidoreductase n=1 Tax=Arthrobacter sp. AQ5-05 TaxID=2184581 RepID=UPI000DCB287A|nr:SDR family oxidoreductase [Arthrobacter sp. AQ5-05]RAX49513.1 SDR family NAD(P)-dependent oxidoreductase [Arthrobacter sp. AQ5-05]
MTDTVTHQASVLVITGASSGIGEATAQRFASSGARVFNLDRQPPANASGGVQWHECDVTDPAMVRSVVEGIAAEEGRIDTAIANAGISTRHAFLEMRPEDIRRLLEINLFGVINLWQAAGRVMFEAGSGTLLATASTNGSAGYPWYSDYNASKAGVLALCRSVALELAPRVRTACVSPGYVLTPMQRSEYTDEMLAEVNERIPMRRHADPAEIADVFFFLASDQARFITGQQLIVDGGELAGGTASSYRTQ